MLKNNSRIASHAGRLAALARALPVTLGVNLVCLILFGLTQTGVINSAALLFPTLSATGLDPGQSWRLLSPVLLHHTPMHLLLNLVVWTEFARQIERNTSSRHLALILFLTALAGNFSEYFVKNHQFGGLSGVALGAAGYTWVSSQYCADRGRWNFSPTYIVATLGWAIWGIWDSSLRMANGAHLGGLISGALLGFWFRDRATRPSGQESGH
jgi:GlpG protein